MNDEITFRTVLRNDRKTKGVVLWDWRGNSLGILEPGKERTIESWNPQTLYAPYSEVIFKEDGEIETVPNPEFPAPKGRWLLRVLNKDGGDLERRIINHREVVLPKGYERTFELSPEDPLAVYSRMELVRVLERSAEANLTFPEYSRFKMVVKDKFINRSESELKELEAELKRLAEDANA